MDRLIVWARLCGFHFSGFFFLNCRKGMLWVQCLLTEAPICSHVLILIIVFYFAQAHPFICGTVCDLDC
jgi:hypothetical protein